MVSGRFGCAPTENATNNLITVPSLRGWEYWANIRLNLNCRLEHIASVGSCIACGV